MNKDKTLCIKNVYYKKSLNFLNELYKLYLQTIVYKNKL